MVSRAAQDVELDFSVIEGEKFPDVSEPALILNSRQSKTPLGSDKWVKMTIEAVKRCVDRGVPIIASTGMNTWELILWAVGEYGGRAVVILPQDSEIPSMEIIRAVSLDFNLDPENHFWLFISKGPKQKRTKAWWEARDNLACKIAGQLIPVSVREGGRFENYLAEAEVSGKVTVADFRVGYNKQSFGHTRIILPDTCRNFTNWHYLTHWTCRCYGPWPGELSHDFYSDVVAGDGSFVRSASATLKRILEEKTLRASGHHIREGRKVVAFTSLKPDEAVGLMRWRKRYVRPTFEPYGIAIHYHAAPAAGIRPVTYVQDGEVDPSVPPELHQGYGIGDWPNEKEWRAVGDVDLAAIASDDIAIVVPDEIEAGKFSEFTNYKIIPLESESAV